MVKVDTSENLTRFIFSKNDFRSSDEHVRYSAFMPPSNKLLSVFRIFDLADPEVWELGDKVGILRERTLLARADIKVSNVNDSGLDVDANDDPPRHANIVGWPEEKSEIKLKAIELADRAQLHLRR
ncbi:hypothetical protein [Candidatus Magnetominusculus dajiuhuensis]|uniref:hypothetical protein n=1 Tax=Candidatus Magnetominusculus dajiuhuensis TaxID=3137712 RepID=UPI003B428A0E